MIAYIVSKKNFIIEWVSTVTLIAGVALTSFNIHPANLWVSLIGNAGWLLLGWMWKRWSLFTVEFIITAIYIVGIYNLYLG
jgi:hypothetical protein